MGNPSAKALCRCVHCQKPVKSTAGTIEYRVTKQASGKGCAACNCWSSQGRLCNPNDVCVCLDNDRIFTDVVGGADHAVKLWHSSVCMQHTSLVSWAHIHTQYTLTHDTHACDWLFARWIWRLSTHDCALVHTCCTGSCSSTVAINISSHLCKRDWFEVQMVTLFTIVCCSNVCTS